MINRGASNPSGRERQEKRRRPTDGRTDGRGPTGPPPPPGPGEGGGIWRVHTRRNYRNARTGCSDWIRGRGHNRPSRRGAARSAARRPRCPAPPATRSFLPSFLPPHPAQGLRTPRHATPRHAYIYNQTDGQVRLRQPPRPRLPFHSPSSLPSR
jgi:hypothetical protein